MIGFFLKKTFYDGWDNLLVVMLLNVVTLLFIFGFWYLISLTSASVPLSLALLALGVMTLSVFFLAVSHSMAGVARYKSFSIKDFIGSFKEVLKHGVLFGVLILGIGLTSFITLPYYFSIGNTVGFGITMLLFWILVIVALSLQWFFPIRSQLDTNFKKCIKKSFIIFFDNPGFSLFMGIYALILLIISVFAIFLVPGFTGINLAYNNAFRLRMYKYDWLEEQPEEDFKKVRKSIPWDELLAEDDDIVGHRSFRSFIFPWKD